MKKLKEYIKKCYHFIKEFIIKNKYVFFMSLPFIITDIFTRLFGSKIGYFKIYCLVPNLFTLCWIFLFSGIILTIPKKIGKWVYLSFNIVFIIFYLINNIYYDMTSNFFSFNLMGSASEGMPYIIDTILNCSIWVYLSLIPIIILVIWGFKSIPKIKKFKIKKLCVVLFAFLAIHSLIPILLGRADSQLVWSAWKNPRNIYDSFNDSNKSMRVSGLYEYFARGIYITYLKADKKDANDLEFLEEIYSNSINTTKNKYTSKFKGKNLIFLQLEGMDDWVLDKKTTPTLYNMQKNSINFTKHYSFYTGGGSTFNSELTVNTGFIVPFSYNKNAYTFNQNYLPYSMPEMFKKAGYVVNAFHMNSGEYYSRSINYKNWGFDNYYGLKDMYNYATNSYMLDRELILNEEYSNLMFPENQAFVDYIITYSVHLPFNSEKGVCKMLVDEDNTLNKKSKSIKLTEEECVRRQAKETDYMVELLLQKLDEKNLIDNTIIVVYSDHYLYTLEDKTILDKYKETDNNLINKTPFFIWDNGSTKANIKKVTSQLNILPTVLNLYGLDYNPNYYIATDALDTKYKQIVFFSDYSWYNGSVYVEGGEVTNKKKISKNDLEEYNYYVNNLTKKNDLTLKYNYFKLLEK